MVHGLPMTRSWSLPTRVGGGAVSSPCLVPTDWCRRLLRVLLVVGLPVAAAATDWPQWRGPTRDGQVGGSPWPARLDDAHLRRQWRVELGPSYSGPIVVGGRVFTTETREKKEEVVTALDRATGAVVWRVQWDGAMSVPFFARSNGDWIRATPACDGERLVVAGMRDVLVCLDVATGRHLWRVDFVEALGTPLPDFGFVSSPLLDGDAVYVQAGAGLVKIDKRTGEVRWRTLADRGGMWGSAFSSPIVTSLAGQRQVVVQTREKLAGVDPEQGTVLWEQPVEAFRGMNILTPVVLDDTVFTSTYGGRSTGFAVGRSGTSFTLRDVWRHKAQGYMSTPVVVDGVAYHHLKSQRVMAIEVATGRELWTSDASFGKYWSWVAQGDRLLALDQQGILRLLRAHREKFDLLDERRIADAETWAHLAVTEDGLWIRELNALAAYRWTVDPAPAAAQGAAAGRSGGGTGELPQGQEGGAGVGR